MKTDKLLTKRKYMHGLQCLKYLWVTFGDPNLIPEPDMIAQHRFNEKKLVRELAQKLYPDGIKIPVDDFVDNIEQTKVFIKHRKPLFDAGILANNIYSKIDILKPAGNNSWDIIEVKDALEIKAEYIPDLSFQKFCCQKAGLNIKKCFITYINKEYVRQGELAPEGIFKIEDITDKVEKDMEDIQQEIDEMFKVINTEKCPNTTIGQHCKKESDECPLRECCWEFLPLNNVFELSRGGKKSIELFNGGIYAIKNIPDGFKLTDKQHIQKKCALMNSVHISKEHIKDFLNTLQYPIYYLDFESFSTAMPRFNGARPYQQMPFQFSVHIVKDKNNEVEHRSFLADGNDDPRPKLLASLINALGGKGSIVVYYQSFEKTRLKELAEAFTEHKAWVEEILERIIDLYVPFSEFHYYNSEQKGKASIKDVLPAITGKGYKGMAISDGQEASIRYLDIAFGNVSNDQKEKTRKELEEYCCLDTEGMICIIEKLKELINTK